MKILTDSRLLTSSREGASPKGDLDDWAVELSKSEEMLEVSHEALIREWPELRKWVNESRDELRFERRLAEASADWEKGKRDTGLLWSGTRLGRANEWVRKAEKEMPPTVQAFLDASRQQARRLRLLIVGLASVPVLVVVGFLVLMTYQARQQAKRLFDDSIVTDRREESH